MEPTLETPQTPDQYQPSSIPTDTTDTITPAKLSNNNIKIGLLVFLWIIAFLIVVLWYAAYNYQGVPKEKSNNEISSINSENTSEQKQVNQEIENTNTPDSNSSVDEMVAMNPEDGIEIVPTPWEALSETNPTPENQEALPPTIIQESPEVVSKDTITPDICTDGSCNNGCWPTEYWNGTVCQEAWKYKTHATQCVTNSAKNLPSGYFVAHFLWDSGDCAGNDYNIWSYSNMEWIRDTDKCQSWKMICKKEYSDSCVLGAGACTCYDL